MDFGVGVRAAMASTVLLASCATPGPKQALEPIEAELDSWAALTAEETSSPVTSNWLADLRDPSIEMVVVQALSSNYDLRANEARTAAQRARARITRADLLPSIGGGFNAERSARSGPATLDGVPIPGQTDTLFNTGFSTGVQLNWEIDIWGRLTDQTRAAYLDAAARELDLGAAQLSLAGSTAQSYYGLTAARLQRQLAERDVETGRANLRIIERRYERGISSSLDLRLARSSLASSEAQLQSRKRQELEAARQLEVLLGRYPAGQFNAAEALPQPGTFEATLGDPESLLVRRPDIVASERRLKAAGLRVSAARKAFLPSLSLTASYSTRAQAGFDGQPEPLDVFDFESIFKNVAGSLSQPLFQGGRLIANERATKAEAEAALYDYATTALTAWREVEDAIAAEEFLAAREDALRTAFVEAEAAEDLTERRYLAGTTNIFDLINAQQRRIQAEGQLIDAQRARLTNRIDLYLALGAPYQLAGEDGTFAAASDQAEGPDGQGGIL